MKNVAKNLFTCALLGTLMSCGSNGSGSSADQHEGKEHPLRLSVNGEPISKLDGLDFKREVELNPDESNRREYYSRINEFRVRMDRRFVKSPGEIFGCLSKIGENYDGRKFVGEHVYEGIDVHVNVSENFQSDGNTFECRFFNDKSLSRPADKEWIEFEIPRSIVITGEKKLSSFIGPDSSVIKVDNLILDTGTLYIEDKNFSLEANHFVSKNSKIVSFDSSATLGNDNEDGKNAGTLILNAANTDIKGLHIEVPGQKGGRQLVVTAQGASQSAASGCSSKQVCDYMRSSDLSFAIRDVERPKRICHTEWSDPANGGKGHQGAKGVTGTKGGAGGAVLISTQYLISLKTFSYNFEGGQSGDGGPGGAGGSGQPGGHCPQTGRTGAAGSTGEIGPRGDQGIKGASGNLINNCVITSSEINLCGKVKGEV